MGGWCQSHVVQRASFEVMRPSRCRRPSLTERNTCDAVCTVPRPDQKSYRSQSATSWQPRSNVWSHRCHIHFYSIGCKDDGIGRSSIVFTTGTRKWHVSDATGKVRGRAHKASRIRAFDAAVSPTYSRLLDAATNLGHDPTARPIRYQSINLRHFLCFA